MARLKLEAFEEVIEQPEHIALQPVEFEEVKLAAFEKGYSAGWEDAVAAQEAEVARLRADLGRNLQDLTLTYQDARAHVLQALDPLLRDMVGKVLPMVARASLAHVVLEHLRPEAEAIAAAPVQVIANPATLPQIREMLSSADMPLRYVEEPSLGECQVYLRTGAQETRVDLDGVIEAIAQAIDAYYRIDPTEKNHG